MDSDIRSSLSGIDREKGVKMAKKFFKFELKLTDHNIPTIRSGCKGDSKNDYVAWDAGKNAIPGFGLRVRNGRASWIMQYQVHGRGHRIKLGDQNIMSADVARSAAKEAAGK